MAIGKKNRLLKECRQRARINQGELAKAAGITQSHLSRMETGDVWASNEVLELIAKKLGVPVGPFLDIDLQPNKIKDRTDRPSSILRQDSAPDGLRQLAEDKPLHKALEIKAADWMFLTGLDLPSPIDKWGYVNLLITMKASISG